MLKLILQILTFVVMIVTRIFKRKPVPKTPEEILGDNPIPKAREKAEQRAENKFGPRGTEQSTGE